jgi:hypothetical protein
MIRQYLGQQNSPGLPLREGAIGVQALSHVVRIRTVHDDISIAIIQDKSQVATRGPILTGQERCYGIRRGAQVTDGKATINTLVAVFQI